MVVLDVLRAVEIMLILWKSADGSVIVFADGVTLVKLFADTLWLSLSVEQLDYLVITYKDIDKSLTLASLFSIVFVLKVTE